VGEGEGTDARRRRKYIEGGRKKRNGIKEKKDSKAATGSWRKKKAIRQRVRK